ncbi:MAG: GDSL-type esterase/lipase family protein [Butyricicoccus sp.]
MKHTFLKRIVRAGSLVAVFALLTACGTPEAPVVSEPVVSEPVAETEADLSNAAILGNSYVDGFVTYNVLPDTDCFYRIGLTVRTAFTKTMLGSEIPVIDELENGKTYDRIFLMFGENELGWPNTQAFYDGYGEVIDAVRERQPEAVIFIQSILPVSAEVSAQNIDCTNNEQIVKFNGMLQELAEEKNAVYLDVSSVMTDENGCLPDDAATDGIHPGIEYYKKWAEYLKENAVIYKDA